MAKDTGYDTIEEGYVYAKDGKMTLRNTFPVGFSMLCTVLFMVPVYLAVYAARQPVIKYFHGEWYYILAIIPIIIVLVHNFHVRNGPNRYVTNLALLVPSTLLLIFGMHLYTSATSKAEKLFSTDCNTMLEKSHLQREWEVVDSLYQSCLKSSAASRHLNTTYLAANFRVQDCTEYQEAFPKHRRDWSYLQDLEEKHACSGFCAPGMQLWSKGPHQDSCAVTVASVFKYTVMPNAAQVVVFSLITLCFEMIAVVFLLPTLGATFGKDY